jgi:hypothetical protein
MSATKAVPHKVVLTVQRQLDPNDFLDALSGAGAVGIRVEHGSGDSGAGVSRYFNFVFSDPLAERPDRSQRIAQGFVALTSEEHPDGWTHLRLGSDARGRDLIVAVAEALGGRTLDERTGEKLSFDRPVAFAMG